MFTIEVTHLVKDAGNMMLYSASIMEVGEDAGPRTWRQSLEAAKEEPLLKPEQYSDVRDWLEGFGAWEREEIDAYSADELNAMVLQFVAGDIREMEHFDTIEEYKAAQEEGRVSGYLYQDDDGKWFFQAD